MPLSQPKVPFLQPPSRILPYRLTLIQSYDTHHLPIHEPHARIRKYSLFLLLFAVLDLLGLIVVVLEDGEELAEGWIELAEG